MTSPSPEHGSPGNVLLRNWQPADNIKDYLRNCREGLEDYSDERAVRLLGWSRMKLWRVRKARQLPDELFELLIGQDKIPSWRELAAIAGTLYQGDPACDTERCPHCGEVLRRRRRFSQAAARIVSGWLDQKARP